MKPPLVRRIGEGFYPNTVQLRLALFVKVIFSNEPQRRRGHRERRKRRKKLLN
jgi:hypothetical protein